LNLGEQSEQEVTAPATSEYNFIACPPQVEPDLNFGFANPICRLFIRPSLATRTSFIDRQQSAVGRLQSILAELRFAKQSLPDV
jgi:hypothetical protein